MKVMIDPGHGGGDPGAITDPLTEKVLNLELANVICRKLEVTFCDHKITRTHDEYLSLAARYKMANKWGADYFISVHHNSFNTPGANGYEVLYYWKSDKGSELADSLCQYVSRNFPHMRNRGLKPRKGTAVLRGTRMPAILIEAGFISSEKDRRIALLDETTRRIFYNVIAEGVLHVFK